MAATRSGTGIQAPAKRAKVEVKKEEKAVKQEEFLRTPRPEELEPGTCVVYWDICRGQIKDAFSPLDHFWLLSDETGDYVRRDNGDIVDFQASDLLLPAPLGSLAAAAAGSEGSPASVLLVASQELVTKVLEHFGFVDLHNRQNPQQLLAIGCEQCEATKLDELLDTVEPGVMELGKKLRPDIQVGVRTFHLRQALLQVGRELQGLKDDFILASVHLPFGKEDIASCEDPEQKRLRSEVWNQVDLCVTSMGTGPPEEAPEVVARSSLGESCGIEVTDVIWEQQTQVALRNLRGVPDLPLQFNDACGVPVYVILLPPDSITTTIKGVLCFNEAPGVKYGKTPHGGLSKEPESSAAEPVLAQTTSSGPARAKVAAQLPSKPPGPAPKELPVPHLGFAPAPRYAPPPPRAAEEPQEASAASRVPRAFEPQSASKVNGKTIDEWEAEQDQFNGPALPPGWLRIKSRTDGSVYYFNKKTQQATFVFPALPREPVEPPLPPGWTKQMSKTTGQTYYFHAGRKESTYDRPTS